MWNHRTLFTLTLLLTCVPAAAAGAGGPGVAVELTRTTFNGPDWSWGTGFGVGGFATFGMFKSFSLQPEILYVRKVSDRSLSDGTATIRTAVAIEYVEMPLLMRYVPMAERHVRPVFYGGVFVAFRTRARARSEIGDASVEEDMTADVRESDAGLVAGVGVEWQRGRLTWTGDLRYVHGLQTVSAQAGVTDWKTRSIAVRAGVCWSR